MSTLDNTNSTNTNNCNNSSISNDCSIIALSSIVSIFIAKDLSITEISVVGGFFTMLGQNLTSMASYNSLCPKNSSQSSTTNSNNSEK